MRMQALVVGLAVTVLAAGCAGGGEHHSTFTSAQALAQVRADGFTGPVLDRSPGLWRCGNQTIRVSSTTARPVYRDPSYSVEFGDRRTPPNADGTGNAGMEVIVFRSARLAARCARAEVYSDEHFQVRPGSPKLSPYKVISPTTVELGMHKPGAPGTEPGQTGEYDTEIADGRVLALGLAHNARDSQIVQADLTRIAPQIAG